MRPNMTEAERRAEMAYAMSFRRGSAVTPEQRDALLAEMNAARIASYARSVLRGSSGLTQDQVRHVVEAIVPARAGTPVGARKRVRRGSSR